MLSYELDIVSFSKHLPLFTHLILITTLRVCTSVIGLLPTRLAVTQLVRDRGRTWTRAVLPPSLWREDSNMRNFGNSLGPLQAIFKKSSTIVTVRYGVILRSHYLCFLSRLPAIELFLLSHKAHLISFRIESRHTRLAFLCFTYPCLAHTSQASVSSKCGNLYQWNQVW